MAAKPTAAAATPGFIDVRQLIAELDDDELMRSADAYFSAIGPASEQCRKPWGNPKDAVHQTRHLGLVLDAADLFRGADVLDFGCATGWLTMGLAQMGCNAVGVDISPNALKLAEGLKAARPAAQGGGTLRFLAYDGHTLPLPDASLDRIVCFDAFHHVRDQAATIREFARVLRPGGRAAFIEPGPEHSKTPQSQAEMARFKVIENDVSMLEITRHALAAGFEKPRMLVQFAQPFTVDVDDFNAWAEQGIARDWSARALKTLEIQLTNGQCFFLVKARPADGVPDSRRPEGLAAEIVVQAARRVPETRGRGIELEVLVRNTGRARWLTDAGSGQVNLGVHLAQPQGAVYDNNFARLALPRGTVEPGEQVLVKGTLRLPDQAEFDLHLDLVSELVAWFGSLGATRPAVVPGREL
ncbi:methyltransferase domain-containing protein [Rubrivivax sp. JA1024]|nr:methyltransferase domain-containing protein [Rubrivivax sp. JA1024]